MKGELLMYVEKTDTYTCDFCGHNAKWDASDDVHGELWSCEAEGCGKVFCSNRCIQQHVQSEFQKRRIRNELF